MNVFILGNGFDLQHGFLTKYINFLNILEFLIENYDEKQMNTVGDVLSSQLLQSKDIDVKKSYELHKDVYSSTDLDSEKVYKLIKVAKSNLWLQYFFQVFDKDIGWIDFEKEIEEVIGVFRKLMQNISSSIYLEEIFNHEPIKYDIIKRFNFFCEGSNAHRYGVLTEFQKFCIREKYLIEKPPKSKHYLVNKESIVYDLYCFLRECADILKDYLFLFVDNVAITMTCQQKLPRYNIYNEAETIISFNYTRIFEFLYGKEVMHIHGNILDNIVLGINSDKYDSLDNLDTTFLSFKKYFQRVFYHTDSLYLKKEISIKNSKGKNQGLALNISGHSLDVTDKDTLKYWIELADKIFIYYYKESDIAKFIKNLVAIFGKDRFDEIRSNNKLEFKNNPGIIWVENQ